jgi:hypothetical protein
VIAEDFTDYLRANRDTFLRVYATARAGEEGFMEHRFPGLTHTGYLIETGEHVLAFASFLNITEIEKW